MIRRIFGRFFVRVLNSAYYYRYPLIHWYVGYLYICTYLNIFIKVNGWTVKEFAHQGHDIPMVIPFLKYELMRIMYPDTRFYAVLVQFESIEDLLSYTMCFVGPDPISLLIFPFYLSFFSLF